MNEETAEPEPEADETGGNADKKREKRRAATEGKSDGAEEKRDGIQEEESDGGEERHRLSEESDFCSFILFVSFLFIPAPKKKKKKKKPSHLWASLRPDLVDHGFSWVGFGVRSWVIIAH